jgi:hypothetical protein
VTIEMTVTLLFLYPLSRAYKAILVSGVTLVRSALLSLASTWSFAHAPMLTQSDFRVSEVDVRKTSARSNVQGSPVEKSCRKQCVDLN